MKGIFVIEAAAPDGEFEPMMRSFEPEVFSTERAAEISKGQYERMDKQTYRFRVVKYVREN